MAGTFPPTGKLIKIATRWRDAAIARGGAEIPPLIDVVICLTIAHRNGTELDVDALLAAPAEDLDHDVGGIVTHIDRATGALGGLFKPIHTTGATA